MTLSAWVYMRTVGENNSGRIIAKETVLDTGWDFAIQSVSGTRRLLFEHDYSTTDLQISSVGTAVNVNVWTHVAMTWTGTNSNIGVTFYVNGFVMENSGGVNGNGSLRLDSSQGLYIGNSGDRTRTFDGIISEVAFWSTTLNSVEILNLATSKISGIPLQTSPDKLVGYWPLNDFSNNVSITGSNSIIDRSTGNSHGSPSGTIVAKAEEVLSYP